ncbi:MAG: glycosyltransferase family 39 protein [Acidobacteriia bacterium]|nr:glycosyltransferase family 39 protein [Terriglobia bacterium]
MAEPLVRLPSARGGDARAALGIACGALVLRLLVVARGLHLGLFSDMQEYYDRAVYLLDHHHFLPDAFRPPAYPVLLAAVFSVFSRSLAAVRITQALLGAAAAAVTFLLARRSGSRRAAMCAGVIVAVYPAWCLYPAYVLSENLFAPLLIIGFWLWFRDSPSNAFAAGLVLGAATLTRTVGVAAIGGILVGEAATGGAQRLSKHAPALLVGFVLIVGAWTARNAALYHRFVPIDTNNGYNFLVGNNPQATGRLELADWDRIHATYLKGAATDAEANAVAYREAVRFMREHPGQAAGLAVRKLQFLIGLEGREHAWMYGERYWGRVSTPFIWFWGLALLASFPALLTAVIAGLAGGAARARLDCVFVLTLAMMSGLQLLSFGETRFHLPWIPLLAIAAGHLFEPRPERYSRVRLGLAGAALLFLFATWTTQWSGAFAPVRLFATTPGAPPRLPY